MTHTLRELVKKCGRPFYAYDLAAVARQAGLLRRHFAEFEFVYSVKTNPFPPLVAFILSRGLGIDAASLEEVNLSAAQGAKPQHIFYSTPGKTEDDIRQAMDKSVVIADSYYDLQRLDAYAKDSGRRVCAGVRINPNFTMAADTGGSSKFGIDEEDLMAQKEFFSSLSHLTITGIHVHLRSQVLDEAMLLRYYEKIFALALDCKEKLRWDLRFINFGSGIGVAYSAQDAPLNIPHLSEKCRALFVRYKSLLNARLIIETGRFVVCEAGSYVTPIVDIKESRGTKYLVVQNGLNGFLRPALAALLTRCNAEIPPGSSLEPLFTAKDACSLSIFDKNDGFREKVTVVGNLCTATDVLASDILLPRADIGDRIVISNAGSYACTLSPLLFSSHAPPLQFCLEECFDPRGTARQAATGPYGRH